MAELDALYRKIDSLEQRKGALEILLRDAYPHKGRHVIDENTSAAQAIVNVLQPRMTERVKGLLMASSVPLTSGDIHEQLKPLGLVLEAKSNPWALIHGICRRLVDQQFAREVDKDGRKAWIRAK
ncbi:MAG: hypothetical protein WA172_10130 [Terriglobales bacterium]